MASPTVSAYIAAQPKPARAVLQRVRATIRKALPRAVEGISYQIPIYKLDGRMVLYFAGFQQHYSIYPATAGLVRALGKQLADSLHHQATIQFSYDDPIPTRLITRIAKLRAAEVAEHQRVVPAGRNQRKPAKKTAKPKPAARRKPARRRAAKR